MQFERSRFDHIGLPTESEKDGESWVEATRVWVTNPRAHPFNIEWLRFEPDSPVTGLLRTDLTSPIAWQTSTSRWKGTTSWLNRSTSATAS